MKIFAKLFLIALVAVLGFGFGVIRTINNENAPLTLLPESVRPAKLAELPKAIDAFYVTPNDTTHRAAYNAIIDYRRSFADTLTTTLQEPSQKIDCTTKAECDILRKRQDDQHIRLMSDLLAPYQDTPEGAELHKKFIILIALDRRFNGNVPLRLVDDARKKIEAERNVDQVRERFFRQIDLAVTGNEVRENDLLEYLKVYAEAAEKSFRPLKRGMACPSNSWPAEVRACRDGGTSTVALGRNPNKAQRAAAVKKLITERFVTYEMMRQALSNLVRV
jgi:hypothetical protein